MSKHRSFLALALVLALLVTQLSPALAAEAAPKLSYRQSGSSVALTIQSLSGESVYGVQLELTIPGSCTNAVFTPSDTAAYAPPCHRLETQNATQVTLYLTSQSPLNQGTALSLGTLELTGANAMPNTAQLILLDRDLKAMVDAQSISVTRQEADSGSSGSHGGSRPNGGGSGGGPGGGNAGGGGGGGEGEAPVTGPTDATLPFTDVAENAWYYEAVRYVYGRGMMNGTDATTFSPETTTSRAMLVTILYRLTGQPAAQSAGYPDVPEGRYYTDAVAWATQNRIVVGYETGLFQPDTPVTREQMATILYRYAALMDYGVTARGDVSVFTDAEAISPFAADAMSWAVGSGLISGMGDGTVAPAGQATRAQVATILTRLCQKTAQN